MTLVADFSAMRIYDTGSGWGRIWSWFYRVVDRITNQTLHQDKLKLAIERTREIFNEHLVNLQPHIQHYRDYLEKSGKGYDVPESDFFLARNMISEWNLATRSFLKIINQSVLNKQHSGLTLYNPIALTTDSPDLDAPCILQDVIDLEGYLGEPLPLSIFKKIVRDIPFNVIDLKLLHKWTAKINKTDIGVKTFLKCLQAITKIYLKKNGSEKKFSDSFAKFAWVLEDNGCSLLDKADLKHLAWRHSLENGSPVIVNNVEYILGKELFNSTSSNDQTRVYSIKNRSDQVVLIAQNTVVLPIRSQRMQKGNTLGIEPARFIDISMDGKVAIMECLKPICRMVWTSIDAQLSSSDVPIIQEFSRLIKSFIDQNTTPSNFSADNFMFNEKFQLKYIRPISRLAFDFNGVEDFIFELARGNLIIYKELMVKSGLASHLTSKFYREIVFNALHEQDDTATDDLAAIYKIGDSRVVDRAIVLTQKVRLLKSQNIMRLRESNSRLLPDQMMRKANDELFLKYISSNSASLFDKFF